METVEGLKAQVETLQEQLDDANTAKAELQQHYDTARAKQKKQRRTIRNLEERSEILEDIEDEIRTECRTLSKEAEDLREKDDRMTEKESEEFEQELRDARYKDLLRKRKTLTKDRDIVISLNNIDDPSKKTEASVGDDDDPESEEALAFQQPFIYDRTINPDYLRKKG